MKLGTATVSILALFPGHAAAALAQESPPAPCMTYALCSLRIEPGFWRSSLVRGAEGERVATFGFRAGPIGPLFERVPVASNRAEMFRCAHNTGSTLFVLGAGVTAAGAFVLPSGAGRVGLTAAGLALTSVGAVVRARALGHLSRAVWEYNLRLGDPRVGPGPPVRDPVSCRAGAGG